MSERERRTSKRLNPVESHQRERSISLISEGDEEDELLKELYNYSYKLPPINPEQRRKYRRKKIPQILITVLQARDLIPTDHNGYADPVRTNLRIFNSLRCALLYADKKKERLNTLRRH
jgi:hypothetical protein